MINERFTYKLTEDERHGRDGCIFYCTATFDYSFPGFPDSLEVATRSSRKAAKDICIARAEVQRKKRLYRFSPPIQMRSNGIFALTMRMEDMEGLPQFTALGDSMLGCWLTAQNLCGVVYEQQLDEQSTPPIRRRRVPEMDANCIPKDEPKGFFHWFKSLFN